MEVKNFSDGLETLIQNHISVYSEEELSRIDKSIFGSAVSITHNKLCEKAEKEGVSTYYLNKKLKSEQTKLSNDVDSYISYIKQHGVEDRSHYELYLAARIILSVCVLCPYVIPRKDIYDFWRWCIMRNLF